MRVVMFYQSLVSDSRAGTPARTASTSGSTFTAS